MYIMTKSALNLTPDPVKERAIDGSVKFLADNITKITSREKCRSIYMRVFFRNDESSHLNHSCSIRIYGTATDPKQYMMRPNSRLWMHCHCPYFFWYCEQALVAIGSSTYFGTNDKGEKVAPGERGKSRYKRNHYEGKKLIHRKGDVIYRNPTLRPYPCKHLYAAILALNRLEAGRSTYKPFTNTKNPYDQSSYPDKDSMPAAYER